MSWINKTLTSSIGRKLVMAITGLFLISFLVVHLIGNISLLYDDGGLAFNAYAHFMKMNPLIKASEVILFLGFIIHIVQGIALYTSNKSARKQGYAVSHTHEKVSWTSKAMGPLGIAITVLLIWHLYEFFRYKYFAPEDALGFDSAGLPNLYQRVHHEFSTEGLFHVPLYCLFMLVIAFHLYHGFQSAFQTLGVNHPKYSPAIRTIGRAYAIIIPLLFALIPILIFAGVSF